MMRVNVGDVFKVNKHFSFCGVSYSKGERFKVANVYSASKVKGEFAISIQDMFSNRRLAIGAEVFGRYMRDGYFTKIGTREEDVDKMGEFKLKVGDIAQTKYSTFTIVKDRNDRLCAIDHEDFALLPVYGLRIGIEDDEFLDVEKVYRLSKTSCIEYGWDESALDWKSLVYPKPKVKLTLSEIKSKFNLNLEEIEIDFEN